MSRRRTNDVDFVAGIIRFVCPAGHDLGRAIKQLNRYSLEAGLVRVDGANGETKIKTRCAACEAEGIHRDLQASWDGRIRPLLDELEADRRAGQRRYVIGE